MSNMGVPEPSYTAQLLATRARWGVGKRAAAAESASEVERDDRPTSEIYAERLREAAQADADLKQRAEERARKYRSARLERR